MGRAAHQQRAWRGTNPAVLARNFDGGNPAANSLDLSQDPTAERVQYWAPVGHYKIGQPACFLVEDEVLQKLFTANINIISFSSDHQIELAIRLPGRQTSIAANRKLRRRWKNWNLYADIDLPGADGETLIAKYIAHESTLNYGCLDEFLQRRAGRRTNRLRRATIMVLFGPPYGRSSPSLSNWPKTAMGRPS